MGNTRTGYYEQLRTYVRDRIRQERGRKGLRQVDLAEQAGVTEKWISRLETQGDNLSLKSLASIAWALGLEAGDLLPTTSTKKESTVVRQAKGYIDEASPQLVKLMVRLLKSVADWQAGDR